MGDTVYQEWRANRHGTNEHRASNAPAQPSEEVHVSDLGSGSDFTPFLQHVGIASLNVGFGGESQGGIYHSIYDDFTWYSRFGDPDFVYSRTLAQTGGTLTLRLADSDVLPFDFSAEADAVAELDHERQRLDFLITARGKKQWVV